MIEVESALRLQGVRAGYGREPVLKGVDLELGPGFHEGAGPVLPVCSAIPIGYV